MFKVFSLCVILLGLPGLQWGAYTPVIVDFTGNSVDVSSWPAVQAHLQQRNISPDKVTFLTLHQCDLTQLPEWVAEKMPNLKHLRMERTPITALPENIDRLTKLERILAPRNKITGLPSSFNRLIHLTEADFSHNNLKNLSKSSFKLPKLTRLNLYANQIATLPDLSSLVSLQRLFLSHNKDIRFEPHSKPLASLEILDLAYCNLKTVPSFFGDMSSLRRLNLTGNPLLEKGSGNKWGKKELKQRFANKVRF